MAANAAEPHETDDITILALATRVELAYRTQSLIGIINLTPCGKRPSAAARRLTDLLEYVGSCPEKGELTRNNLDWIDSEDIKTWIGVMQSAHAMVKLVKPDTSTLRRELARAIWELTIARATSYFTAYQPDAFVVQKTYKSLVVRLVHPLARVDLAPVDKIIDTTTSILGAFEAALASGKIGHHYKLVPWVIANTMGNVIGINIDVVNYVASSVTADGESTLY
jgi:hypothetical protein